MGFPIFKQFQISVETDIEKNDVDAYISLVVKEIAK